MKTIFHTILISLLCLQISLLPSTAPAFVSSYGNSTFQTDLDKFIATYNKNYPPTKMHPNVIELLVEGFNTSNQEALPQSSSESNRQKALRSQAQRLVKQLYAESTKEEFEFKIMALLDRYLEGYDSAGALNMVLNEAAAEFYSNSALRERAKDDKFLHHYAEATFWSGASAFAVFGLMHACSRRPSMCKKITSSGIAKKWTQFRSSTKSKIDEMWRGASKKTPMGVDRSRALSPYVDIKGGKGLPSYHVMPKKQVWGHKDRINARALRRLGTKDSAAINEALIASRTKLAQSLKSWFMGQTPGQLVINSLSFMGITLAGAVPIAGTTYVGEKMDLWPHLDLDLNEEIKIYNGLKTLELQCTAMQAAHTFANTDYARATDAHIKKDMVLINQMAGLYNLLLKVDATLGGSRDLGNHVSINAKAGTVLYRGLEKVECPTLSDKVTTVSLAAAGSAVQNAAQILTEKSQDIAISRVHSTVDRYTNDFAAHIKSQQPTASNSDFAAIDKQLSELGIKASRLGSSFADPMKTSVAHALNVYDTNYAHKAPRTLARYILSSLEPNYFNQILVELMFEYTEASTAYKRTALLALFNQISILMAEESAAADNLDEGSDLQAQRAFLLALLIKGGKSSTVLKDSGLFDTVKPSATFRTLEKRSKTIEILLERDNSFIDPWVRSDWVWPVFFYAADSQDVLWLHWMSRESLDSEQTVRLNNLYSELVFTFQEGRIDPLALFAYFSQLTAMKFSCDIATIENQIQLNRRLTELSVIEDPVRRQEVTSQLITETLLTYKEYGLVEQALELVDHLESVQQSIYQLNPDLDPLTGANTCGLMEPGTNYGSNEGQNAIATLNFAQSYLTKRIERLKSMYQESNKYELEIER